MWATLTVMATLGVAPNQVGGLQLTNERVTYGFLGPARAEKLYLPGDMYFLHFDIEGLAGKDGNLRYSMKMELIDPKGKPKFTSDTEERTVFNILGGNRVPGFAHANLGLDAEAGTYTLKLTVTDLNGKKAETLQRKFEVGKPDFGIVGVGLMTSNTQLPAGSTNVVGQAVVLTFNLAGYARDPKTKQPRVNLELRVTEGGTPTTPRPVADEINRVDEKLSVIPGAFDLALTRPGKFTVELKATDLVSKKTATVALPMTVLDPQK